MGIQDKIILGSLFVRSIRKSLSKSLAIVIIAKVHKFNFYTLAEMSV
jgi:hypothetical protein